MSNLLSNSVGVDDKQTKGVAPDCPAPFRVGEPNILDAVCDGMAADRPKPLGLLPVPEEVEGMVARETAGITASHGVVLSHEAIRDLRDQFTLQHYYAGHDVAYCKRPEGIEVLAVGAVPIDELVSRLGQDELDRLEIRRP